MITAMGDPTLGQEAIRQAKAAYATELAVNPNDREFGPLMRASRRGTTILLIFLLLLPIATIVAPAVFGQR